ncbi:MAG TPA: ATP-binding protein [Candidatus Methylomirabilis sp.]|nr:ATP-binding protein [Candidatus Methylomirabilis sp.]
MTAIKALDAVTLCAHCDPNRLTFETTAELFDLTEVIGQPRATDAIQFGIGIRRDGYNLYVLGAPGTGRHTVARQFLQRQAATESVPSDWCYVNNFEQPHKPRALRLPAGMGVQLRDDMDQLMEDLRSAIPAAFESEEYRTRRQELEQELKERQEQAFEELRKEAESHHIALIRTPSGMAFAPTRKGEVLNPEEFQKLSEAEQKRIEAVVSTLEEQLARIIHQFPQWRREGQQRIRGLDRDVTMSAVGHLIDELRKKYAPLPEVVRYLDEVREAVIENSDDFRRTEEGGEMTLLGIPIPRSLTGAATLRRFQVNVLIDHSATRGAPVIYEDSPSYQALIGRVEHLAQMGALVTDFTLIKPGALLRANGGYLILDVRKVLMQPYAWEGLKRVLSSREVRIESLGQALSLVSTVSLEPEPVPLDVKVVLVGERLLYYLLYHYDPDFSELFKVAADFEDYMARSEDNDMLYARLVATQARREGLLALDRQACARVIEHGARLAADAEKLSIRLRDISDLLREADYWARQAKRSVITGEDVQRALDAKVYRSDRVRERIQEEIRRGTLLIDTAGERVGQVNGLSVVLLGDFMFGHPSRITAQARLGKGEVLDIQREVELGGPIHSKGVMILAGFLGALYAPGRPLSLAASLAFEQTYGEVEGDSASSAELYALLSALAEAPVKQSLAVTGSVNQHGEIQAIGGVNEKIEGFFDVCRARGLTGDQGVLIPAANVKHLMLRHDVVEACAQGKFHVYPVRTVDEGIELLTGLPAGERDAEGLFPDNTINQRVEVKLLVFAEQARAFGAPPEAAKEDE